MRFSATAENRGVVVTEAGSYVRRTDSCITQLKAQGPCRTCQESEEEEEGWDLGSEEALVREVLQSTRIRRSTRVFLRNTF